MAVNKNFVVKNGLEVNENLILANADDKRVGIGSTTPTQTLDVKGGIGATDLIVTGFTTLTKDLQVGTSGSIFYVDDTNQMVGVGTSAPAYLLDVRSSVSTGQTALYVYGDMRLSGDLNLDDITIDDINATDLYVSGLSTFIGVSTHTGQSFFNDIQVSGAGTVTGDLSVGGNLDVTGDITYDEVSGRNINISGLSTFEGLSYFGSNVGVGTTNPAIAADSNNTNVLNTGIVTANYLYGDGSGITNVTASSGGVIGLASEGVYIGTGVTTLDLKSSNGTAWTVSEASSGFATATITPGVSIGLAIALGG